MTNLASHFSRWKPAAAPATTTAPLDRTKASTTKVSAALSLDSADVCPYCKSQMSPAIAMGINVFMCDSDRHIAPAPNV